MQLCGKERYPMAEHTLLRSQKNELLQLIKKTRLDPFNFEWSAEYSRISSEDGRPIIVSKISYNNSPYYFIFDLQLELIDHHYCFFSPGKDELQNQDYPGSWENQLYYFQNWLGYLEIEMHQPDLWDDLFRHKIAGEGISMDTPNEPFSVSQAQQIAKGIAEIKAYLLSEYQTETDAQKLINQRLEYLLESSKRQGRTDWFHTCIGVFAGIATALAMSPDQTRTMWTLLKNAVSGIVKLIPI